MYFKDIIGQNQIKKTINDIYISKEKERLRKERQLKEEREKNMRKRVYTSYKTNERLRQKKIRKNAIRVYKNLSVNR